MSRSGTLVYQIVHELSTAGIGQSTCIGMGGDPVHGIGFIESLELFEADPDTDLVIMTGEIGGDDEERAAAYIAEHVAKPVVAYIAGFEAPPGKKMGHAGADRDGFGRHGRGEGRGPRGGRRRGRADALGRRPDRGGAPGGMTANAPPDLRPGALVFGGFRRGVLLVFLPVALAAQAIAWIAYAISGAYTPLSWLKIGLAYALASARVPFDVTTGGTGWLGTDLASSTEVLAVALGALSIALIVLAFRAGRSSAAGVARRPVFAALAGSAVGLGVAVPMLVAAVPVELAFPDAGVTGLTPSLPLAFLMPLALAAVVGAIGGLAAACAHLEEEPRGERSVAVARGAGAMLAWGLVFAAAAFLLVAALRPSATASYVRSVRDAGIGGAVLLVHHGLLLPNQAVLVWSAASGAPVTLRADDVPLVEVSLDGWDPSGLGAPPVGLGFLTPAFLLIPIAATLLGGRVAGRGARSTTAAVASGLVAGLVYAAVGVATAWFASIDLPFLLLRRSDHARAFLGSSRARVARLGIARRSARRAHRATMAPQAQFVTSA